MLLAENKTTDPTLLKSDVMTASMEIVHHLRSEHADRIKAAGGNPRDRADITAVRHFMTHAADQVTRNPYLSDTDRQRLHTDLTTALTTMETEHQQRESGQWKGGKGSIPTQAMLAAWQDQGTQLAGLYSSHRCPTCGRFTGLTDEKAAAHSCPQFILKALRTSTPPAAPLAVESPVTPPPLPPTPDSSDTPHDPFASTPDYDPFEHVADPDADAFNDSVPPSSSQPAPAVQHLPAPGLLPPLAPPPGVSFAVAALVERAGLGQPIEDGASRAVHVQRTFTDATQERRNVVPDPREVQYADPAATAAFYRDVADAVERDDLSDSGHPAAAIARDLRVRADQLDAHPTENNLPDEHTLELWQASWEATVEATRCPHCGQFASQTHTCPSAAPATPGTSHDTGTLPAPGEPLPGTHPTTVDDNAAYWNDTHTQRMDAIDAAANPDANPTATFDRPPIPKAALAVVAVAAFLAPTLGLVAAMWLLWKYTTNPSKPRPSRRNRRHKGNDPDPHDTHARIQRALQELPPPPTAPTPPAAPPEPVDVRYPANPHPTDADTPIGPVAYPPLAEVGVR